MAGGGMKRVPPPVPEAIRRRLAAFNGSCLIVELENGHNCLALD